MTEPTPTDPKTARKREAAAKSARKLRLTDAAVTVLLCADTKEAGCASAAEMKASWKALKALAKQSAKEGTRVAAVKSACLDVCKFGPLAQVHSPVTAAAGHGGGAWYGGCDPAALDRILAAHAGGGDDPAELRLDSAGTNGDAGAD